MSNSESCDCGTPFGVHTLAHRDCSKANGTYESPNSDNWAISNKVEGSDKQLKGKKMNQDFQELIEAQNRTTHAVRAFVRFLFIQLTAITFAVFLWNVSTMSIDLTKCAEEGTNCSANGFFQTCAVLVWILGVVVSSNAGWGELKKSEIK